MIKGLVFFSLAVHFLGVLLSHFKLKRNFYYAGRTRALTILKPMKGIEFGLSECVRSFLELPFIPGDELIFCFESELDPGYSVVRDLILSSECKAARLFCRSVKPFDNPKIQNIYGAYLRARNDTILISDSNVIAPPGYLRVLHAEFNPGELLTSLVSCRADTIDAAMLNTFTAKWMLVLNFIRQPTVVGKSMMFSRRQLEQLGGMKSVGKYIAEDYEIGYLYAHNGLSIKISSLPIIQYKSVGQFWSRYMRWTVMRKCIAPVGFMLEPFLYGTVTQGLSTYAFGFWWGLVVGTVWAACDYYVAKKVSGERLGFWNYLLREWTALPLWLHALVTNKLKWKGVPYRVHFGGECERC
jgi:ceramide glucosyltransferase